MARRRAGRALLVALLATACTPRGLDLEETGGPPPPDPGAVVYDPDRLHEVVVELAPEDWDALRYQRRNVLEMLTGECLEAPFESPYTWFPASVVVDGTRHDGVRIRKKGFIGSESSERPSLKLDLDGDPHDGLEALTLNNGQQDPAVISQCLGYALFRAAGVPASRCSLARLVVNGEDLGVYSNVEPVKPPMLARWYPDATGDLWEGQGSDFRDGWLGSFDPKEGEADPARLEAVVEALDQPDDAVLEALDAVVDLDAWTTFWAMEVLLGHWDGYAGNTNNFFVYRDPADGRLDFLPWGIDALFDSDTPFGAELPTSVVAWSAIPRRVYLLDQGRATYGARLLELLDRIWVEPEIQARISAMEALVLPAADPAGTGEVAAAVDEIRQYVAGRRANIEAEVAGGWPGWSWGLRGWPCMVDRGDLGVTLETTWGNASTQDAYTYGDGSMTFVLDEVAYPVELGGVVVGESHDRAVLLAIGRLSWGSLLALWMAFPLDLAAPGTFTMDWSEGQAYLYYDEAGTGDAWAVAAYLGDGPVTFTSMGTTYGDPVAGSVSLEIYAGE